MEVSSHSLLLLQQLNIQREFGFLCDCTVAIGNVYFKAHRAVLAAFSNYFKMIFIHQSSECIKIQPTDIQPDVFSYLLHIMYTGTGPKQQVDQSRLQEGIKFLHAYQLCRRSAEGQDATCDSAKMSNLYGIQISSQPAPKASLGVKEPQPSVQARASPAGGASGGLSNRPRSDLRGTCSVASGEDASVTVTVKQERVESEGPSEAPSSPAQGPLKEWLRTLYCHHCGERCGSRQGLREHLFNHATSSLPSIVPLAHQGEGPEGRGVELETSQDRPLQMGLIGGVRSELEPPEEPVAELRGSRRRKASCAICSLQLAPGTQAQENMNSPPGRPARCHRHNRVCRQPPRHCCTAEVQAEVGSDEVAANPQDNGSSCYSLDSEISQESADTVAAE
ncbi:zinc finger and BTB domain-containing protein 25-like isoform X2 [Scleropages formosus]|uniref:Zinc finger and BTB domain containing 25 n=2 Tax=Scleropages formosus TaxID=113540 RepID=A0A8C9T616_SCLFO|nr:zinc finger and BTB domain-containing protein 25-like isoform X2 [Scleropages formosus]